MFTLPSYRDLSKDQDSIYNLPASGNYLVVGPPGSGKTVVAVYRSWMYQRENIESKFLVYNKTLNQYLEAALATLNLSEQTSTFHKWFYTWYQDQFHVTPPEKERFIFDWNEIYRQLGTKNKYTKFSHLIIDEGQDFPKEFYMVLPLLVENLTVFADENQRIYENNSTVEEIRTVLGLKKILYLKKNFRNSRPIAEFSSCFYAGLQSGIPDLPDRLGNRPTVILTKGNYFQITTILNYSKNNPKKNIGIFLPTKDMATRMHRALAPYLPGKTQMYLSGEAGFRKIDFTTPGVKIFTYQSAKGLEFDTVFLPYLETRRTDMNPENEKMRYYVLCSRAKDDLFLLTSGKTVPCLLESVPPNLYTIKQDQN
jgi:superfamily I DNA/RNA helicase